MDKWNMTPEEEIEMEKHLQEIRRIKEQQDKYNKPVLWSLADVCSAIEEEKTQKLHQQQWGVYYVMSKKKLIEVWEKALENEVNKNNK